MEMEGSEVSIEQVTEAHLQQAGLPSSEARHFLDRLHAILDPAHSMPTTWQRISTELLRPTLPFRLHQLLYYSTYKHWDTPALGPPLGWIPTP